MLNIWLIQRAELLPVDGGKQKLLRTGILAQSLIDKGHEVLWWTSTFDHYRKRHRYERDSVVTVAPRYRIYMLKGTGYGKNLSFSRIIDQHVVASKFRKLAKKEPRPDAILCSLPSIDLSLAAVEYGKANGVQVVLDMRDMWPDLFLEMLPVFLRPFGKLVLLGMFFDTEKACAGATAITGVTEAFVDWGLKKAKRFRTKFDRCFPLGQTAAMPALDDIKKAESFWDERGIRVRSDEFVICFFGTMGSQLDVGTIIKAVKKCNIAENKVKIVICGHGDKLDYYRNMAGDDKNIVFAGWVNATKLYVLMRRCYLGLDPLPENQNFLAHINNKAIEYMSAGLPILSSPKKGVLFELLQEHDCGLSYSYGNEEELAAFMTALALDKNYLRRMSCNALKLFNKRFTAEKVYSEMAEYLEEISRERKKQNKMKNIIDG